MSKTHTVKSGDRLWNISKTYYGVPQKWTKIRDANSQLVGRKSASDGSPTIYPGDVLIIPDDEIQKPQPILKETIIVENENQIIIKIDGQEFSFWTSYNLSSSIDSLDTFSFSCPFEPDVFEYRDYFRPFNFKQCQVFYGSNLYFNGYLVAPQSQLSPDSRTLSITGYPSCGFLNDCMLPMSMFPAEYNKQDLQQITNKVITAFGLSATFDESPGNVFDKVAIEPEQNILEFLIGLSNQRDLLITNDIQGNLKYWKANIAGASVANLKEGETPKLSCSPNFKPQQFFSHITGIIEAKSGVATEKFTVENSYLINNGIVRPYTFIIKDAKKSDIQTIVKSKAARMFADACSYELTIQGHRDLTGNLWQKNTLINVLCPSGMIYKDTQFLIKNTSISRDENGGDTTKFSLVLPQSYSGEIPSEFPWEE